MSSPRLPSDLPRVLAHDLDHPEAVCWNPDDATVLAGGEAGQLYSIDAGGVVSERLVVEGADLLGLALDGYGNVYACDCRGGQVLRVGADGVVAPFGPRMTYPNYPAFDAEGTLWVSDSGSWDGENGRLIGLTPDGESVDIDFGQFSFSNGVAVSGREIFMVTSRDPAVWTLDPARGIAEVLVRLPKTVPDGIALDADGGIWISCFQPNRILRLDPDGSLETVLDDWSGEDFLSPTNIAFTGPELKTVVMASLCGRTIRQFDSWVAGRSLEYPQAGLS